uniref:Interleukin-1 n=1 Tax=Sphenodon punctatus TaxID=8508 RepID=A0A8D0FZP2_SPHPU
MMAAATVPDPEMVDLFNNFFGEESLGTPNTSDTTSSTPTTESTREESATWTGSKKVPRHYRVRDIEHKAFYLKDNSLVAVPLQGEHATQEEKISVVPNRSLDRSRFPLIMGIKGGIQGLSCGTSDQPKLQLEDAKLMELFEKDDDAKRFTFFKSYNGNTHKFESAAYPGWFICTSAQLNEPITLTNQPGNAAITDFHFLS